MFEDDNYWFDPTLCKEVWDDNACDNEGKSDGDEYSYNKDSNLKEDSVVRILEQNVKTNTV